MEYYPKLSKGGVVLDQSVARKFVMVMSMFIAVFATVFVCGTVVNDSAIESYRRPIPKSDSTAFRQDEIAYTSTSDLSGKSYVTATDSALVSSSDASSKTYRTLYDSETTRQFDVTFYSRPDPSGDEAVQREYESIEEQFLYMTTVTTTGTVRQKKSTTQAFRPAAAPETTTWQRKDTAQQRTTSAAKPTTVTTAKKPLPTSGTTAAVKPSSVHTQKPTSDSTVNPTTAGSTVGTTVSTAAPSTTEQRNTVTTSASRPSGDTTAAPNTSALPKETTSAATEATKPTTVSTRATTESTTHMITIATGVFYPDDDEIAVG